MIDAGGAPPRAIALGTRHLSVGRGPDNDIVLPDPQISRHHALVWCTDAGVFLRDLGSANGTFVDEERVRDTVEIAMGADIRLGANVHLSVREGQAAVPTQAVKALAVEDLTTGMRQPLHSDRFVIGNGAHADLRLPDGDAATLIVHGDGEVWLGQADEDRRLELEEEFQVGAARFRVVEIDPTRAPTVQPEAHHYPYTLRVGLDGPGGMVAELSQIATSQVHRLTAENRVVLLYVLARKLIEDLEAGMTEADRGWAKDDDVIVGVWGRGALTSGGNRLKVLVHRVRKEFTSAGFEPWCIEKRSGHIRLRVAEVEVSD